MKLTLEEYSDWIPQEVDRIVKPATTKGRKLLEESTRALAEAREFFESLSRKGDKDMASKKDPVSYRAARLVGHGAGQGSEILYKVQVPQEISWENLKGFKDSLSIATRSLRDIRARTSAELSGFYILDMRSFSGVSDRIAKQSERLSHFLEGEGSALQKSRALTSILSDAQTVKREMIERDNESKKLSLDGQLLSAQVKDLMGKLERLEGDKLLRELLDTERSLRNESRQFRNESLAHLKRPLRKLKDLSERGDVPLGLEEREALSSYIESPYRSFLSRRAGPYAKNILESLRGALESGKMGFKPRKASRVLTQLVQLTSSDELITRQNRGRLLLSRRKNLLQDPQCKNAYESRKDTLRKLEEVRQEATQVEERRRSVEQKSEVLITRIEELLSLLEAKTKEYVGKDLLVERPMLPPSREVVLH